MSKLAVIDIGTNSIHMVLAELRADGGYTIVDRYKDMARLGNGAFAHRCLTDDAMGRGLEVLRTLVTLARNKGFDRIQAVATSAVREARNGGEFVNMVAEQTGITVRVISGKEEARLIFLGVQHGIALSEEPVLVVDVGGGSVELIVGTRDTLLHATSLKLGAIRLVEHHLTRTPPTPAMLEALDKAVREQLQAVLKTWKLKSFAAVIATSGMAANIAEVIHLSKTGRALTQVNLATVKRKDLAELESLLVRSGTRARLGIPGLDPKRVDTLLPATIVLHRVMELAHADELTVCDRAIREGVIFEFIRRHRDKLQAEADIPDVRRREVRLLASRCQAPEVHSLHVASLALRLFDQTKSLHGLGEAERAWLEFAAILHDIGYLIHPRQHHKHAYYLVKHSHLAGFAVDEIDVIANVARYHRRALPTLKHEPFEELPPKRKRVVRILAALLRVADGLDRTHFSVVRTVDVKIGRTLTVVVHTAGDAEFEIWAAQGRADLLSQVFRRPVTFKTIAEEECRT